MSNQTYYIIFPFSLQSTCFLNRHMNIDLWQYTREIKKWKLDWESLLNTYYHFFFGVASWLWIRIQCTILSYYYVTENSWLILHGHLICLPFDIENTLIENQPCASMNSTDDVSSFTIAILYIKPYWFSAWYEKNNDMRFIYSSSLRKWTIELSLWIHWVQLLCVALVFIYSIKWKTMSVSSILTLSLIVTRSSTLNKTISVVEFFSSAFHGMNMSMLTIMMLKHHFLVWHLMPYH